MLEGRFIPAAGGRIFLTCWQNETRAQTAVLCVPPFAEELNCCRRQIATQCEALAGAGMDCFLPDYYGTGDSEGEFDDASLTVWRGDIQAVIGWLESLGYEAILLWGVRFGCALLAQYLRDGVPASVSRVLFWQPELSGARVVRSLNRLQAVSPANETDPATGSDQQAGTSRAMEVAGYRLSSTLVEELEALDFKTCFEGLTGVESDWIAITLKADLSLALHQQFPNVSRWREVVAPPFWMIPETPVAAELTAVTTEQVLGRATKDER